VVADHIARVGKVEEQQSGDDRIERLGIAELPGVRLGEAHVLDTGRATTRLGNREQRRRLVDRHHRAARPSQCRELERDVAHARAELEHAHAGANPGGAQKHRSPGSERLGLAVEAGDLRIVTAQHVARRFGPSRSGDNATRPAAARPETPSLQSAGFP